MRWSDAYHKSLGVPPALIGWAGLGKSHETSNIAHGFQLLSAGHSSQGESHELREGRRGGGGGGKEWGKEHTSSTAPSTQQQLRTYLCDTILPTNSSSVGKLSALI